MALSDELMKIANHLDEQGIRYSIEKGATYLAGKGDTGCKALLIRCDSKKVKNIEVNILPYIDHIAIAANSIFMLPAEHPEENKDNLLEAYHAVNSLNTSSRYFRFTYDFFYNVVHADYNFAPSCENIGKAVEDILYDFFAAIDDLADYLSLLIDGL